MRGVGGPLLCIGDLLSDVGESDDSLPLQPVKTPSPDFNSTLQPSDLNKLFQFPFSDLRETSNNNNILSEIPQVRSGEGTQTLPLPRGDREAVFKRPSAQAQQIQEKYEQLNKALTGTDHSWTHLTLELCTALETANKLVHSTHSNVGTLKDEVEELREVINRRDSTIEAAKAFEGSPKQPESSQ